jgi:Pyruvate/2-oxoacid:ferredoxin oxidoreductase delta subunit
MTERAMTDTIAATHIDKLGAGPGLIAPQTLDIAAYIEDFNKNVIDAYRRGVADVELPADMGVARSIIAPGTAGVRDFSTLSPLIPQLIADQCVGCMACVSACPDSAILATAQPKGSLARAIETFAASSRTRSLPPRRPDPTSSTPPSTPTCPPSAGIEAADFGLFIDPYHCKGCAECVDVCVAQGHNALVMAEKCDASPAASAHSIATAATSRSTSPCPRRRSSTATRRPWPTSCSASTPSASSAAAAPARAAAKAPSSAW